MTGVRGIQELVERSLGGLVDHERVRDQVRRQIVEHMERCDVEQAVESGGDFVDTEALPLAHSRYGARDDRLQGEQRSGGRVSRIRERQAVFAAEFFGDDRVDHLPIQDAESGRGELGRGAVMNRDHGVPSRG
ncbi:hypothetical protein [Cutibacterium avidum]|uniref:hypothetical protein n=1 Tax=Cutibacterium avidum TaxID=33010 RepID=UPI002FF07C90